MTKEALKQEAEEKAKKRTKGFKYQENCETSYIMGALDFAEPREKQIKELEKDYYANRPTEPYSDDNSPNDWANIAHYAEESLEKAFKRIEEELEKNIKDCENFNKKMKEIKEQWNKEHYQLIKAKEIIAKLYHADECFTYDEEVEQFLKESE
jgi:hypothetical protein